MTERCVALLKRHSSIIRLLEPPRLQSHSSPTARRYRMHGGMWQHGNGFSNKFRASSSTSSAISFAQAAEAMPGLSTCTLREETPARAHLYRPPLVTIGVATLSCCERPHAGTMLPRFAAGFRASKSLGLLRSRPSGKAVAARRRLHLVG